MIFVAQLIELETVRTRLITGGGVMSRQRGQKTQGTDARKKRGERHREYNFIKKHNKEGNKYINEQAHFKIYA